ncbi:MAG TPA: hypothetical protein VMT28_15135, partial [Terriglobales bacterium]|nr:hypothetical protein [Terriglobales bacterium]
KTCLPDLPWDVLKQSRLGRVPTAALLGQDPPGKAQLERLHDPRGNMFLRFADQRMKVFGHDHIADHHKLIAPADLFQDP